jgi:hypothetical protein
MAACRMYEVEGVVVGVVGESSARVACSEHTEHQRRPSSRGQVIGIQ